MNDRENTGDTATNSNATNGDARPLPTITIDGRTFTLLFPDLFRPLTADEWSRHLKSIDRHGVQNAIVCDEHDGVIDGGHRLRGSAELGKGIPPVVVRPGLTYEQKKELALSLNADRRQLSDAEIKKLKEQRVERVAAARREGESTRAIAAKEKISDMQVRNDLKDATAKGFAVDPPGGKVSGKDGKKRPAKRRPVSFSFLDDATKAVIRGHELTRNESVMDALLRLPFDKREAAARQLVASGAETVKAALAIIKSCTATAPQPDHVVAPAEAEEVPPPQGPAPPVEIEEADQPEATTPPQPEGGTFNLAAACNTLCGVNFNLRIIHGMFRDTGDVARAAQSITKQRDKLNALLAELEKAPQAGVPPKPANVRDDMAIIRELVDDLRRNWDEDDEAVVKALFRELGSKGWPAG
jgi:hypothetical protein